MRTRQGWFSAFKSKPQKKRRPKRRSRFAKAKAEMLEDRSMLTATVFVDFGDGFVDPDGAGSLPKLLQTTPAEISDDIASGGLQGPDLVDAGAGISSSTPVTITSLEYMVLDVLAIDYNGDSTVDANDYLDLKSDVLDRIAQVYAPFNIDIVEVANATVAGIQSQLAANNGLSVGKNDTYLLMTPTFFFDGMYDTSVGIALSALGKASLTDITAEANTQDDTAIVFAEYLLNLTGLTVDDVDNVLARIGSHEAGHGLGLEHLSASTTGNALMVRSDVIGSPGNLADMALQPIVSRVPLPTATGSPSTYAPADRLGNDPDIGYKSGMQYVTGTGGNDQIGLSRQSETDFLVSVRTYDDDSNEINFYSYTISGDIDNIQVYGGAGNDNVSIGALPAAGYTTQATISVWGMEGEDSISFNAGGTYDQTLDLSVTSSNVRVNYAPVSVTEVDSAIERMFLYHFSSSNYYNFHNLSASTEFHIQGNASAPDRIRLYAQDGVATHFYQDPYEPILRVSAPGGPSLPGRIHYNPGSNGVDFIDFYGSTGTDYLYLFFFGGDTTYEFIGGGGNDQIHMKMALTTGTDYRVDTYTGYSTVTAWQEKFPDLYPGVMMPLQGKLIFNNASTSDVDLIYFYGGPEDDSVTLSELLLDTRVVFQGSSGTNYVNIDLDGQTVASSSSIAVRYTDGTILYPLIIYLNATLNTY